MFKRVIFGIVVLFCLVSVYALDFQVSVSNSESWRDVYSIMLYSALEGADSEFLVSTAHGPVLLNGISKSTSVLVVSSQDEPFVFNYPDMMRGKGFLDVQEIVTDEANLDLLDELPDVNNFIIVGNDFGYNAVAVAQYAKITNSWVFLADRANIDEIDVLISERNVGDVIVYGYVDREVFDTLEKYSPKTINTGDKFLDNVEIMKLYLEINPVTQVVLTNGEFIEKEIMLGDSPILFTGRENVPDQIRDYIRSSDIEIGVLVGNELIGAATNIKRTAGINVIAKFARGSRGQASGVATVEGLDLFYLPSPRLVLAIYAIKYNRATGQLEVTYRSDSNVPAYFKGTLDIDADGETNKVGDLNPIFIAPGDFKTVSYSDLSITGDDILVDVYTLFGEVETALDWVLSGRYEVEIINVIDSCQDQIEISSVIYNKQKKAFYVKLDNVGSVDCFADVEMRDVVINEVEKTIGSEKVEKIRGGKSKKIFIGQEMDDEDILDNDLIEVYSYYGERRESLVYETFSRLELGIDIFSFTTWAIIILVILVILLIVIAFILKRREDEF